MSTVRTHIATEADMNSILSLTNEAFMADAFFKKKEYHERFDAPTVQQMIHAENSRFIIASQNIDGSDTACGSIFFHWEISTTEDSLQVRTERFSGRGLVDPMR
jgi:hypothetical protein